MLAALFYIIGWLTYRFKKVNGWVTFARKTQPDAGYKDYLKRYGFYSIASDVTFQMGMALGWGSGAFQWALTLAADKYPETIDWLRYASLPADTAVGIKMFVAWLAGYVLGSLVQHFIDRRRQKIEDAMNGDSNGGKA
jgi:hypothetical protein